MMHRTTVASTLPEETHDDSSRRRGGLVDSFPGRSCASGGRVGQSLAAPAVRRVGESANCCFRPSASMMTVGGIGKGGWKSIRQRDSATIYRNADACRRDDLEFSIEELRRRTSVCRDLGQPPLLPLGRAYAVPATRTIAAMSRPPADFLPNRNSINNNCDRSRSRM